jgi:hypothetical protein
VSGKNGMRLSVGMHKRIKKAQKFFYLYTSGLSHREIEHLLKKDTMDAFSYFKGKTKLADRAPQRLSVGSIFHVCKEIFISFIMQLTPARRFFYWRGFFGVVFGFLKLE